MIPCPAIIPHSATTSLSHYRFLQNDDQGAADSLRVYFAGPFQKQIDASGEQSYEAARTRPFHYRCFNIEAMIVRIPFTAPRWA